MAELVVNGEFVGPGEKLVAAYLEAGLPHDWVVICNKQIPREKSSREIDFIIVGQHALFAIEEKHWKGAITGDEERWWLEDGRAYPSPINQVHQAQQRLRSYLEREIAPLKETMGPGQFIQERVLLSHPSVRYQVNDPRLTTWVLTLEGCEEDFLAEESRRATGQTIAPMRGAILGALRSLPDRPETPTRVGDYDVIELLGRGHRVVTLKARHESGFERILKVVERPVTADDQKEVAQGNAILREWEVLQLLAGSGIAPQADPYFSWGGDDFWVFPIHLLPGLPLSQDLMVNGLPTTNQCWQTITSAFDGLALVHENEFVHRGITPDRIHTLSSGSIAFSDFQIARIVGSESVSEFADELELPNPYRAPECAADVGMATSSSDVFSLAASLWSWLTGLEFPQLPTSGA